MFILPKTCDNSKSRLFIIIAISANGLLLDQSGAIYHITP
jgi:hypothetical protein